MQNLQIYKQSIKTVNDFKIIETGNRFGNMNTGANFYEEGMSAEERKRAFLEHRIMASEDKNFEFDPYKFYMPSQDKSGKEVILTKEMIEATEDGWDLDIKGDILIVTDNTPGVVVGYPVADCPVVIASDLKNGVTATAHCSAEMIDNYLPLMTIESLQRRFNSNLEDVVIYIGAHAGPSWTYDCMPKWAKESFWVETGAIKEEDQLYKIDLDKALLHQLNPEKFYSFIINQDNTITNPNYYSNSAASKGQKVKKGRHFQGAYYTR